MPGYAVLSHPWWLPLAYIAVMGHITNVCNTLYLHRSITHGGVKFHPVVEHLMRAWLWLTTGIVTREWVAIHRKHHAFADREGDPHSPVVAGLAAIVFTGVFFYQRAAKDKEMLEKYGKGCPDDWVERKIYSSRGRTIGILLVLALDLYLFGWLVGLIVWSAMAIWVPIMGNIINGVGHALGYRNFDTRDHSANIYPWGIWILGEELHNNHHADPRSAKFQARWWEFDIGWMYIRVLSALRLAKVVYARSMNVKEFASQYYSDKISAPVAARVDRAGQRIQHAREQGRARLEHAKAEGKAKLEHAKTEGKAKLGQAKADALMRLEQAREEGRAMIEQAREEGRAKIERAKTEGRSRLDQARAEARTEMERAKANARARIEQAQTALDRLELELLSE